MNNSTGKERYYTTGHEMEMCLCKGSLGKVTSDRTNIGNMLHNVTNENNGCMQGFWEGIGRI
jgi:hypothetical protein